MTQQWRATEGRKTKLTGCAMGAIAGIAIGTAAGYVIRLAVKAIWSQSAHLDWITPAIAVGLLTTAYFAWAGYRGSPWPAQIEE